MNIGQRCVQASQLLLGEVAKGAAIELLAFDKLKDEERRQRVGAVAQRVRYQLGDGDGRFRGDKSARGEKRRLALQQLYDRGTTER